VPAKDPRPGAERVRDQTRFRPRLIPDALRRRRQAGPDLLPKPKPPSTNLPASCIVFTNYFLRFFLTGPYCLRAAFSQPARLPFAFLRQAFSALVSFCVRVRVLVFVQPVTVIGVD
jgi:hypothetical protein